MASCEFLGHDVQTIHDWDHGQVMYRHGSDSFVWPDPLVADLSPELIAAYERSMDWWLDLIHRRDA